MDFAAGEVANLGVVALLFNCGVPAQDDFVATGKLFLRGPVGSESARSGGRAVAVSVGDTHIAEHSMVFFGRTLRGQVVSRKDYSISFGSWNDQKTKCALICAKTK